MEEKATRVPIVNRRREVTGFWLCSSEDAEWVLCLEWGSNGDSGVRQLGVYNCLAHRLIAILMLELPLVEGVEVHHKDGNPLNNQRCNLEPILPGTHLSRHIKYRRGKMPAVDHVARTFWRAHKLCSVCEKITAYRDTRFTPDAEGVIDMICVNCLGPRPFVDPTTLTTKHRFRQPRAYAEESPGLEGLAQIEPQKARAFKDLDSEAQAFMWDSPRFWAERKYDGVRMLLHFTADGIRMTSRRVSLKTNKLHEPTENFPHIRDWPFPENLIGTVLDCEIIIEKDGLNTGSTITKGFLNGTVAVSNAGPEKAIWIQKRNSAWANCYLFDVLRLAGKDCTHWPNEKRRELLEKLHAKVFYVAPFPHGWVEKGYPDSRYVLLAEIDSKDKQGFYARIVETGGEGVMLKDRTKPYSTVGGSSRPHHWWKVKKTSTVDAFITGFIPGEKGYEGLVGAFEVSVFDERGNARPVASVSQMTLAFRREISQVDVNGNLQLDPVLYNKVVEISFQELTKTGRGRHAVLIGFRVDKDTKDCTADQLKGL